MSAAMSGLPHRVYCRPCNMWLNGRQQYEDHIGGYRHKKIVAFLEGPKKKEEEEEKKKEDSQQTGGAPHEYGAGQVVVVDLARCMHGRRAEEEGGFFFELRASYWGGPCKMHAGRGGGIGFCFELRAG